jgi:proline dehydrogenase
MGDIFDEFDPDGTGWVDYVTWSMKLKPTDLPNITNSCKEVGPLALATPSDEEIELIEAMYGRVHTLAETATQSGTRLLIDAEQARFQPAIDNLVLDLQQSFNAVGESDKPIIYNTYQCYLKDAPERLRTDVDRAKRFNHHFGAKLVRGAYMESERLLASVSHVPSPIHDTIEETHACYNDNVDFLLRESKESDQLIEVMCATHNQESIEKAIAAMDKYGVDRTSNTICFGQLYGMSDHLSFNLGRSGYRAYKYVPYGEVHEVIPYLLRRARENSSIAGGAAAELSMIISELGRRLNPLRPAMA